MKRVELNIYSFQKYEKATENHASLISDLRMCHRNISEMIQFSIRFTMSITIPAYSTMAISCIDSQIQRDID